MYNTTDHQRKNTNERHDIESNDWIRLFSYCHQENIRKKRTEDENYRSLAQLRKSG